MSSVVIHYQEIALKGKNRPWFLGRLVRNLRQAVSDLDVRSVHALMGRIEMRLGPDAVKEEVGERIRRTFGIANFSYATRTGLDLEASWMVGDMERDVEAGVRAGIPPERSVRIGVRGRFRDLAALAEHILSRR